MKTIHMKIYIILMFLTGVLQLSIFNISWEYFRIIQAVHILSSAIIAIIFLIPYVNKHTYEFMIVKKAKSKDGIILGVILLMIILSGFYLFFVGNPGSDVLGVISFNIHLYGSFILLFILFLHVGKKIDTTKVPLVILVLTLSASYPTSSYSLLFLQS